MTRGDRPTFAVVVGTTPTDRRLIPVSMVRALTGLTEDDIGDEALQLRIDAALAQCAAYCKLARAGAAPLTLARETVRASWPDVSAYDYGWHRAWLPNGRGNQLLLPWRTPITEIAVTEGETELTADVDYRLLGAGVVERLGGTSCGWPMGAVEVTYTAGFIPTPADPSYDESEGDPLPANVVALIAEQVKLAVFQIDADPSLRSEDVPNIWSGTYNVAGGDSISGSGLLRSLECALEPYRAPPSFA